MNRTQITCHQWVAHKEPVISELLTNNLTTPPQIPAITNSLTKNSSKPLTNILLSLKRMLFTNNIRMHSRLRANLWYTSVTSTLVDVSWGWGPWRRPLPATHCFEVLFWQNFKVYFGQFLDLASVCGSAVKYIILVVCYGSPQQHRCPLSPPCCCRWEWSATPSAPVSAACGAHQGWPFHPAWPRVQAAFMFTSHSNVD